MNTTTCNLNEDETFVLNQWSMWGSDGYPIVKRASRWFVDGVRGVGSFPTAHRTKAAAVAQWEAYIGILLDRKAGRL